MSSLKRTLMLYILLGLAAVLLLSGATVFLIARAGIRAQFDETLEARLSTFAALVVEEPGQPGESGPVVFDYDGPLRESDLGVLLNIVESDGRVVARSPDWPALPAVSPPAPPLSTLPTETGRFRLAQREITPIRELDESYPPDSPRPRAIVQVLSPTGGMERTIATIGGALLLGGILAAAGTAGAVWLGVQRGLLPLCRLRADLAAVDSREPRLPSHADPYPEELAPVVVVLDDLLSRVSNAMQRERRFTDAAAHELRTPIAELRTISQIADRYPEPDRLRRAVGEAGAIATEMEGLLESLLAAARGSLPGESTEMVPLLPIIEELVHTQQGKPLAWRVDGDDRATWTAPAPAVRTILRNLIENAVEYTPSGGQISVFIEREGAETVLTVENGPVMLAAADVDRMFEPLWRADPSRTDRRHRGMGLYIVDSLAESLGLERQAEMADGAVLRIQLRG